MLDTSFQIIEFSVNLGFAIISLFIISTFLLKFKGTIPIRQPNVIGFILMALGLSLHIVGVLIKTLYLNSLGHNIHLIATMISLSVTSFILGSILIAYHNAEETKQVVRGMAIIYLIIGTAIASSHLLVYFNLANEATINQFESVFFIIEMLILTLVYVMMFLQSNSAVRRATTIRLRLMSLASLGFVLVILVDTLVRFDYLKIGGLPLFYILFFLHVLTVGSFYLLVIFPSWFKERFVKV